MHASDVANSLVSTSPEEPNDATHDLRPQLKETGRLAASAVLSSLVKTVVMVARRTRRPPGESPLPEQIASQQAVVHMHQKAIQAGDASPKRAAALAAAMRRLSELQESWRAGRSWDSRP
jgi:hypothetical protein